MSTAKSCRMSELVGALCTGSGGDDPKDDVGAGGPTLKVRTSVGGEEQTHDCEWAFSDVIEEIDWLPLATSQVTFPNILLHELKEEESLEFFITTVQSMPSTKGLLLINTNNSFDIDEKLYHGSEKPSVPTLVVGRDIGIALHNLVDKNPRSVEAMVQLMNAETASGMNNAALKKKVPESNIVQESVQAQVVVSVDPEQFIPKNDGPTLKVRTSAGGEEQTHDCEWAFSDVTEEIDWLPLATSQVTFPNILLHELKEEASLEFFTVQSTKALLLINTNNSFDIDEKFYPRSEKPSVPTLIVGRDIGIALHNLVDTNPRSVEAMVQLINAETDSGMDNAGKRVLEEENTPGSSLVQEHVQVQMADVETEVTTGQVIPENKGIYSSTIEPEGDSTLQRALVTIAIHEQSNLMEEAIADHFPAVKKHGLQVKYEEKQYRMSYRWISECTKEIIDWRDIVLVAKRTVHILCVHSDCPLVQKQPTTEAVLLIVGNKSTIERSFVEKTRNCYKSTPIIAIDEEGQEVWEILSQEKCIECKILSEGDFKGSGKGWSLKGVTPRHPAVLSIYAKIRQLLFGNAPVPTVDTDLFKVIMEHLYAFETHDGCPQDVKKLEKVICDNWILTFSQDFPFYLALSYRVTQCQKAYKWNHFENKCRLMSQKLQTSEILDVTNAFLSKNNFMISCPEGAISAWKMISKSLHCMLEKCETGGSMSPFMKLATLYVKFSSVAEPTQQADTAAWGLTVKKLQKCVPNQINIDGLNETLKLGDELLMDADRFRPRHVAELLFSAHHIPTFEQMRHSLSALKNWLFAGDAKCFEQVFQTMLTSYGNLIDNKPKKYKEKMTSSGNRHDVVFEGLQVLAECYSMSSSEAPYNKLWINWLNMLLKLIKFDKDEKLQDIIVEFFNPAHNVTIFEQYLTEQIKQKIMDNLKVVTPEQFSDIFVRCPQVIPAKVLQHYMNIVPFGSRMNINDKIWRNLLLRITTMYPNSREQLLLIDFFKRAGTVHRQTGYKSSFLCDTLHLDIPRLFYINQETKQKEDVNVMRKFLDVLHSLEIMQPTYLMDQLDRILNSVPKKHQQFHESVLTEVMKVIISALKRKDFSPTLKDCHMFLIKKINTHLCSNVSYWPAMTLSDAMCFHLMCGYLKEIGTLSIEGMDKYYQIIQMLCKPCQWYLRHYNRQIQPVECITLLQCDDATVCDIGPVREFRVHYFKYMKEICNTMLQWKEKITDQEVTYHDIINYSQKIRTLDIIAKAMGAEDLVDINIHRVKSLYVEQFERLNKLLLYYEPGGKWCSLDGMLERYGVEKPECVSSLIMEHFVFPDSSHCDYLEYSPKLSEMSSFKPPVQEIVMRMKKDLKLNTLGQVVYELGGIISELQPNLPLLVFFHLNKSIIFDGFLKRKLLGLNGVKDPHQQIAHLGLYLAEANTFLEQFMKGGITYGEIDKCTGVNIDEMNVDEEFKLFSMCPKQYISTEGGSEAMQSMLKLLKSVHLLNKLIKICNQFELRGCLNDSGLQQVDGISKSLETKESRMLLTPANAHTKWKTVCDLLCLEPNSEISVLFVFETVSDSVDFFHFLDEMGFTGKDGETLFRQQHELVTAKLEQDIFTDSVLNSLFGAFFFVLPFRNHTQSLQSLMKDLCQRQVSNGQQQLETVNSHMHLIRLWFSRVQEGFVENVSSDLESISKSGEYVFSIATQPGEKCQLMLRFKSHYNAEGDMEQVSEWGQENIFDFNQKLGFLQEKHHLVDHFRKMMKAAKELFEVIVKVRDLGYPAHCTVLPKNTLSCSLENTSESEIMIKNSTLKCESWIREIAVIEAKYTWLSFFTIPKILQFHSILKSNQTTRRVILEFFYVFTRDSQTWQRVEKATKNALKNVLMQPQSDDPAVMSSSINVIGSFMNDLFLQDGTLGKKLAQRYVWNAESMKREMDIIVARKSGQRELIHLLVSVYNGIPEYFDILHCHSTTTEQELRAFMNRVLLIPRQYVILEVNHLSFEQQEVLFNIVSQRKNDIPNSHVLFVETASSMMQLIPWLKSVHSEENGITKKEEEVKQVIKKWHPSLDSKVHLVYGAAGDGKTHRIKEHLDEFPEDHRVIVAVNESFTVSSAVQRLMNLNRDGNPCAIFFNFTLFQYDSEHKKLSNEIGWFFTNLLLLGYVEDISTGRSFCRVDDEELDIYIEVPSKSMESQPDEDLSIYLKCFSVFELIGTCVFVNSSTPYSDDKVQLVCKYLKAYKCGRINNLCLRKTKEVRFSSDKDIDTEESSSLFKEYVPEHLLRRKVTQRMFVHYMWRRCEFLENFPGFIYNTGHGEYIKETNTITDTRYLGSTLMETMLNEVSVFCNPSMKDDWGKQPHQQLIYDFSGGGGTIGVISHLPDKIEAQAREKFTQIGIKLPSPSELKDREVLDTYLARALGIRIQTRLQDIDHQKYVLTVDYALKMLDIHERYRCGIPVIIEGETGVGKTSLVDMLSILWNRPWLDMWNYSKECISEMIMQHVTAVHSSMESSEQTQIFEALHSIASGKISMENLKLLSDLNTKSGQKLFKEMQPQFQRLKGDPLFTLLDCDIETFDELFANAHLSCEGTAKLLNEIYAVKVKSVLHKLNVHAALQLVDLQKFFAPAFKQAQTFQEMFRKCTPSQRKHLQVPYVIVYLDEINTASCLGLLKEIITDKTLNGDIIPTNIFIIAACNPHRGHSLATLNQRNVQDEEEIISWLTGTYYVRQLHPTLECLKWDYGSLNEIQEDEYISAKLQMIDHGMTDQQLNIFSDIISSSQTRMREYAEESLATSLQYYGAHESTSLADIKKLAKKCAKSSVSQRDIQRVFTFYLWFKKGFEADCRKKSAPFDVHECAMTLSLGLVYYMRLSLKYRKRYEAFLKENDVQFGDIYNGELQWLIDSVQSTLPKGIAKTTALKENLFAVIACTATRTPLIIVGDPGSSKTLSFHIAVSAVQGKESKNEVFRDTKVYQMLHPHFYQCSRRTTSVEIKKVFERAIERQRSLARIPLPEHSVVFMDEAGLPEQQMESLKVLHYYLDVQEVSFVAISNHILDAAKTNRAISLFRPKIHEYDLQVLAEECIRYKKVRLTEEHTKKIKQLCCGFQRLMKQFHTLYGLRDFMHFVKHLKSLDAPDILQSFERNFNGSRNFSQVCKIFFQELQINVDKLMHHNTLEIIRSSAEEHRRHYGSYNGVHIESRYKLIIDPSDDVSLVRLLFSYNILPIKETRVYICSDFPSDHHSEVTTIQKVIHSVAAGHTVLLFQTDKIHENFYDLFNQRFRSIRDQKTKNKIQYFANIAIGAHSKPCRVNPKFECFIVIDEAELKKCPSPFLNRFEKYYLDHKSLLELQLRHLPPCLKILLQRAKIQVKSFIRTFESTKAGVYGLCEDTLESLFLTILPTQRYGYTPISEQCRYCVKDEIEPHVALLITIHDALRKNAGFRIPMCDPLEVQDAAEYIMNIIMESEKHDFQEILKNLKIASITSIVDEAFSCLYNAPSSSEDEQSFELYNDACAVIAVIIQWLVMCLCKRLMQLITPEALVIHNQELPRHYCQAYMKSQEHFDLKTLVFMQQKQMEKNEWDQTVCASKLICFTRESALIHGCPQEYNPSSPLKNGSQCFIADYIWDKDKIMLLKLSVAHSQDVIQELLSQFLKSECEVFVIVVNSHQIHRRMINHLRIMIEDEERLSGKYNKIFVLLFQIPPQDYYTSVYPALFQQGWDHHYLDSIAPVKWTKDGPKTHVLNMQMWFELTCMQGSKHASWNDTVDQLLKEAIPVVTSKLDIPTSDLFSSKVDAFTKSHFIERLLVGDKKRVGALLVRKFCHLWNPQQIAEYIDSAANAGYSTKSTLNIIETLETTFRFLFFDFLIYMLSFIGSGLSLDWIFNSSIKDSAENLFYDIIESFPCPTLFLLPTYCSGRRVKLKYCAKKPLFPFFHEVSGAMKRLVSKCSECIHDTVEAEYDATASIVMNVSSHRLDILSAKIKDILLKARHEPESGDTTHTVDSEDGSNPILWSTLQAMDHFHCLGAVVKALQSEDGVLLCEDYYNDFFSSDFPFLKEILNTLFSDNSDGQNISYLITLHVKADIEPAHMANLKIVLRKLSEIHELEKTVGSTTFLKSIQSSLNVPIITEDGHATLSGFTEFLVETFADTLAIAVSRQDIKAVTLWQSCYHNIVTDLSMEDVHGPLMDSKLIIMHATSVIIQTSGNMEAGMRLYADLRKYATEKSSTVCPPGLEEMVDYASKILVQPSAVMLYFEEILQFLFCKSLLYKPDNLRTLLSLINKNTISDDLTDSISIKFYLSKTLTQEHVENKPGSLNIFIPERRDLVGQEITDNSDVRLGSYTPPFYQMPNTLIDLPKRSAKNGIMEKPLCHLYFIIVLEKLLERNYSLMKLNTLLSKHNEILAQEHVGISEKALLHIEKQALTQVLIHHLAYHFDFRKPLIRQKLYIKRLIDGISEHMCDESTGGSAVAVNGHGIVFIFHIQMYLSNPIKMLQDIKQEKCSLVEVVKCIQPLQSVIKCDSHSPACCVPFLGLDVEHHPVGHYYQKIYKALQEIHETQGSPESVNCLLELAESSVEQTEYDLSNCCDGLHLQKKELFRMLLWLGTYYGFRKKQSRYLFTTFGNEMSRLLDPEFSRLLQCFAYQQLMTEEHEKDISKDESCDPLYNLFNKRKTSEDESDASNEFIQNLLVYLVATIVACPNGSNHLWFNLFKPEELENTFLPGFMLPGAVCQGNYYNAGVCLNIDGLPKKPAYLTHLSNESLSINSLHLLLWTSFGAFCISLLHKAHATTALRGKLISECVNLRHYCFETFTSLCDSMGKSLHLTPDQLNFYLRRCMLRIIYVSTSNSKVKCLLQKGVFHFKESADPRPMELEKYERVWHQKIFIPSFDKLENEYIKWCGNSYEALLQELSRLKVTYPYYPSCADFINDLLLNVGTNICNTDGDLFTISQFALSYERLCLIGMLLPDLIKFYQWIHTEYRVTWKYAAENTVEHVISKSGRENTEIEHLYERVYENYNKYLDIVEGNLYTSHGRTDEKVHVITSKTKLLTLLSTEEEEQYDSIFLVIGDMVEFHNEFLKKACRAARRLPTEYLKYPIPDEEELLANKVNPKQICSTDCIIPHQVHSRSQFVKLIRARWMQSSLMGINVAESKRGFDFERLQIDIMNGYILTKPLIADPRENMRLKFVFRRKGPTQLRIPSLEMVSLRGSQWVELNESKIQEIECEYHSARYEKLMKVVTALWTVSGHIRKYSCAVCIKEVAEMKVPEFLLREYDCGREHMTTDSVIREVGFLFDEEWSLNHNQMNIIKELQVKHTCSMLNLFIRWIKEGEYNFHYLPLNMKVRMKKHIVEKMDNLPKTCEDSRQKLLQDVISLEEMLLQHEQHLRDNIIRNAKEKLKMFMKKVLKLSRMHMDHYIELIPDEVKCENYVHLRTIIGRVKGELQDVIEKSKSKWTDHIDDLWDEQCLKHLRDAATPYADIEPGFVYDPIEHKYGFEHWVHDDQYIYPVQPDDMIDEKEHPSKKDGVPMHTESITVKQKQKRAKEMTTQDVGAFLKSISLEEYVSIFEKNGIDGEVLFELGIEDLKELGISKQFQCKKVLRKFTSYLEN